MRNYNSIVKYIQKHELDAAFNEIKKQLNEFPDDPLLYTYLGNILFQVQDFEQAEIAYKKAILLDETSATAYFGIGNVLAKTEQYERARKAFLKALELGLEEDPNALFMVGLMYFKEEDYLHALPYLQRAYELDDKDLEAYFQYGLALAKLQFFTEAAAVFKTVIEEDTSHSDAYYNLGLILLQKEEPEEALHLFERAIGLQKNHTLALKGKKLAQQQLAKNFE